MSKDPLSTLGSDIFQSIILQLPYVDLLIGEQVSKSWNNIINENPFLWRIKCHEVGVDPLIISRLHELELRSAGTFSTSTSNSTPNTLNNPLSSNLVSTSNPSNSPSSSLPSNPLTFPSEIDRLTTFNPLDDQDGSSSQTDKPSPPVNWKKICQKHILIGSNWIHARSKDIRINTQDSIHRFKMMDFQLGQNQYMVYTSWGDEGGLYVMEVSNGRKVFEIEGVRSYAHLEHVDGHFIFDSQDGRSLEVWRTQECIDRNNSQPNPGRISSYSRVRSFTHPEFNTRTTPLPPGHLSYFRTITPNGPIPFNAFRARKSIRMYQSTNLNSSTTITTTTTTAARNNIEDQFRTQENNQETTQTEETFHPMLLVASTSSHHIYDLSDFDYVENVILDVPVDIPIQSQLSYVEFDQEFVIRCQGDSIKIFSRQNGNQLISFPKVDDMQYQPAGIVFDMKRTSGRRDLKRVEPFGEVEFTAERWKWDFERSNVLSSRNRVTKFYAAHCTTQHLVCLANWCTLIVLNYREVFRHVEREQLNLPLSLDYIKENSVMLALYGGHLEIVGDRVAISEYNGGITLLDLFPLTTSLHNSRNNHMINSTIITDLPNHQNSNTNISDDHDFTTDLDPSDRSRLDHMIDEEIVPPRAIHLPIEERENQEITCVQIVGNTLWSCWSYTTEDEEGVDLDVDDVPPLPRFGVVHGWDFGAV
ncbi:hypothetical protein TREMEDRAFT_64486 [Tremella mesenterica DSM 1558]|uniref:uncharacterized protein n=1 Tax=Tremella mesenterica (strain ATCC 24925 / CBS 8224 / DSM 1558 / NBRC 9311 / NRRL Y-6157 / RJB 2259-6 / UBC 559-6) TaxID=578456 RepID=UPI0003F49EBA|nr:uncharacterized protein TREMEDRAFT_64486 [Tremella mesenterica DSM 1558]EIW67238.1 hypothetical protein TREMEDRAFT_64486 [Tremella mesenterica DSM 1558]